MKVKIHVPVDKYAFAETEVEGEPKAIADAYYELLDAFQEVERERNEKILDAFQEVERERNEKIKLEKPPF